jgi:hypothetical protein
MLSTETKMSILKTCPEGTKLTTYYLAQVDVRATEPITLRFLCPAVEEVDEGAFELKTSWGLGRSFEFRHDASRHVARYC